MHHDTPSARTILGFGPDYQLATSTVKNKIRSQRGTVDEYIQNEKNILFCFEKRIETKKKNSDILRRTTRRFDRKRNGKKEKKHFVDVCERTRV